MSLPHWNPFAAVDAICNTCGEEMTREIEKDQQGRALRVKYSCVNPKTGCSYFLLDDGRLTGQLFPIK